MPDPPTALPPTGLLCELLEQPQRTQIQNPRPRFGWIVRDQGADTHQTAYQIIVASEMPLPRSLADELTALVRDQMGDETLQIDVIAIEQNWVREEGDIVPDTPTPPGAPPPDENGGNN